LLCLCLALTLALTLTSPPCTSTRPLCVLAACSLEPHHRYRSLSCVRLNYVWRSTFPRPRHLPSADYHCPIGSASGDLVSQPSIPAVGQVPPPAVPLLHLLLRTPQPTLVASHPSSLAPSHPPPSILHPRSLRLLLPGLLARTRLLPAALHPRMSRPTTSLLSPAA
jgi:hypothetical protein